MKINLCLGGHVGSYKVKIYFRFKEEKYIAHQHENLFISLQTDNSADIIQQDLDIRPRIRQIAGILQSLFI